MLESLAARSELISLDPEEPDPPLGYSWFCDDDELLVVIIFINILSFCQIKSNNSRAANLVQ